MDESSRFRIKVTKVIQRDFRVIFGAEKTHLCGHFLDRDLTRKVHCFADWVEYPKGDRVLRGHSDYVRCSMVSTDGYHLFTGSGDTTIAVWNMKDYSLIHKWTAHNDGVNCLAYHSGRLVSGGRDNDIHVWHGLDYHRIRSLMKGHSSVVNSVEFNHDGTLLVSSSDDGSLKIWNFKTGLCLRILEETYNHYPVKCALFCHALDSDDDGIGSSSLISANYGSGLRLYRNPIRFSDEEPKRITFKSQSGLNHIRFNCDGSLLCCFCGSSFTVYRWPTMESVSSVSLTSFFGDFHPNNPDILVFSDDDDYSVTLLHVSQDARVISFSGHKDQVYGLSFTPDGTRLISVSYDNTVRIYDLSEIPLEPSEKKL